MSYEKAAIAVTAMECTFCAGIMSDALLLHYDAFVRNVLSPDEMKGCRTDVCG